MPTELAAETFMQPFHDLNQAIKAAMHKLGPDAKVIVMPHAGSTLPCLKS